MILDNNLTVPSLLLREQGFEYISVSTFNYTSTIPKNATYPQTVVSIVYVTKNSTVANQVAEGAVSTSGAATDNNLTLQYYNYSGHAVRLYGSLGISVFNASAVHYDAPIYQYTTTFTFSNIAAIVTIGGNMHMDPSISFNLSKILLRRLVQSNVIG